MLMYLNADSRKSNADSRRYIEDNLRPSACPPRRAFGETGNLRISALKRIFLIPLILIILSSFGCGTISFPKINYVPLENIDPRLAREDFSLSLPDRLRMVNSVVLQYKWRSFLALGYADVFRSQQTFAVSALSPAGIKLFELSGDSNSIKPHFVLKEISKRGDLTKVVGEDIRRIYFDIVPSRQARIKKERYKIIFIQPSGPGVMKYIFAGNPSALIEKRYYEFKRCVFRVFYYQYRNYYGKSYPAAIIFKNYRFGYNLIIRLKELR